MRLLLLALCLVLLSGCGMEPTNAQTCLELKRAGTLNLALYDCDDGGELYALQD